MVAFFQAKTNEDMITPTITAMARSCQTVTADTVISTTASAKGILYRMRKLLQAKVPTTTMNITPTRAAIGTCSIHGAAKRMKPSKAMAATMPERRPRPPALTLMMDWPIMAQPPMPPKRPLRILAEPCAIHSRLPDPRVSVMSSMRLRVIKDSINPTAASSTAVDINTSQWPLTLSNI